VTDDAAGDEVVQWNGIRLRGRTFEEVYDIIFESKFDPQVELTVHRPVGNTQQRRNDAECVTSTQGLLLSSFLLYKSVFLLTLLATKLT